MALLYVALFCFAVTATALALVAATDGVWFIAILLLLPAALIGLWLSRE
jgi:hypothetical protein